MVRNKKKTDDLIARLRQREETGMEEFLLKYSPLLRYIIGPILSDPREQEECVSDVAMRVWDKIHQFDETKGSFTTWLTVLTRNMALNRARDGRKSVTESEDLEYVASGKNEPEKMILHQERMEQLKSVLSRMYVTDQQIFYRKYYYLQSTAQIAAEMGLTERAVEGRLYRIKQKLRKELGGEWYE